MHLEYISLTHFKNYLKCELKLSPHINCLVGPNGSGKTNLLDAIYYLSLTKSAFNSIDQQNIQHQQGFFALRGRFTRHEKSYQIQCSVQTGSKKIFEKDQKPYSKLSEHIGQFPVVLISPRDTDILRDGSSTRRKFLDGIISQIDAQYLEWLLKYQHLLNQRNHLLKTFASRQSFDVQLISAYDQPMLEFGNKIFARRRDFINSLKPVFAKHYQMLSQGSESVDICYRSGLFAEDFKEIFLASHQKDLGLQRTTLGIHKDDLDCTIGGYPMRKFGSQGQQKSFVIALKLAQFEILKEEKGFKPILLLDDIFDRLDDRRIEKLMKMVAGQTFGQLFITDARPERTARIMEEIPGEKFTFHVDNGHIEQPSP